MDRLPSKEVEFSRKNLTGARRSPPLPEVPTMAEAGVRGYESSTWYGVLGPKALPRPIVMKLNGEIVAILKIPEVRDRLLNEGAEPVGNTPEQFGEFIKSEIVKWGKVFKAAGCRATTQSCRHRPGSLPRS